MATISTRYGVGATYTDYEAVNGNHLSLRDLLKESGENVARAFLLLHVCDLNEFCGTSRRLTEKAIDQIVDLMQAKCQNFRLPEFALFFSKVKGGDYGVFMGGCVQPQTLMQWLNAYIAERREIKAKAEQRKSEQPTGFFVDMPQTEEEWKQALLAYVAHYSEQREHSEQRIREYFIGELKSNERAAEAFGFWLEKWETPEMRQNWKEYAKQYKTEFERIAACHPTKTAQDWRLARRAYRMQELSKDKQHINKRRTSKRAVKHISEISL